MGVNESHEDAQIPLKTMTNLSDEDFEKIVKSLESISKTQYSMQVSKWDLMQLMSMLTSIQIKRILQLISGQKEPSTVGIHQLMVALVLSRRPLTIAEKVKRLFTLICYEVSPGRIQKSEVQYVFHLVYNWIRVTTHLQLSTSSVQEQTEKRLFSEVKIDSVFLEETYSWIGKYEELGVIFNIYTKDSRAQQVDFRVAHEMKNIKAQYGHDQSRQTGESALERQSQQRMTGSIAKAMQSSVASKLSQRNHTHSAEKPQTQSPKLEESKLTHLNLRASVPDSRLIGESKTGTIENESNVQSPTSAKSHASNYDSDLKQPQKQLMWNAQVLTRLDEFCPQNTMPQTKEMSEKGKPQRMKADSESLMRMEDKLCYLRERNVDENRMSNLIDLNNKFDLLERTDTEFYGQRQLTYMMRSLFYEKQLINDDFSISRFIKCEETKGAARHDSTIEEEIRSDISCEETQIFDEIMSRAQTAKSFKEFYRQNLSELKYETVMHQTKLQQYLSIRGNRRIYEKKKYKCLGEISTVTMILAELKHRESNIVLQAVQTKTRKVRKEDSQPFLGFALESTGGSPRSAGSLEKGPTSARVVQQDSMSLVPPLDWFFVKIYHEIDQLRSSGLSRKDFIEICLQKRQKTQSMRTAFFLEGAVNCLKYVSQVKTFTEMPEFRDFLFRVEQQLHEENRRQQNCFNNRQQTKQNFTEYLTQVGKLKGFHHVLNLLKDGMSEIDFECILKRRLQLLFNRLESIDVKLVQSIQEQIGMKKSNKLFFTATGKLCVYKCISKALPARYLINYLGITLAKIRMMEFFEAGASTTSFPNSPVQDIKPEDSQFAKLQGNFLKLLRMIELDKYFNLEAPSQDSQTNYDKFTDDLVQIADDERQSIESAKQEKQMEHKLLFGDAERIAPDLFNTVVHMVKTFLQDSKMDQTLMREITEFIQLNQSQSDLLPKNQQAQHSETDRLVLEDLKKQTGAAFFDFVEVEDVFKQDNKLARALVNTLRPLSTTLNQANLSDAFHYMLDAMLKSHATSQVYAKSLHSFQEQTYVEEFKASRMETFNDFMVVFKQANKGHLINNFNMYCMSLPLEFSPETNYWFAYTLQGHLEYVEKEEKLKQLTQVGSNEILHRKSKFMKTGPEFQPHLTMSCFWLGPCYVLLDGEVNVNNHKEMNRFKSLFDQQYQMTKGAKHREHRLRQSLFSDQSNFFEMRARSRDLFIEILEQILAKKDRVRDLAHLQMRLYTWAYGRSKKSGESGADLQGLIQKHLELKMKVTDDLRTKAVFGILQGAQEFVTQQLVIIEQRLRQEGVEDEPDKFVMMKMLLQQIKAIIKAQCYKPQRSGQDRVSNISTVSIAQVSNPDLPSGSTKQVTRADLPFMLKQAENDLVNTVCRTHCYYKLIGQAAQADSLSQFFGDIEQMLMQIRQQAERRRSVGRIIFAASTQQDQTDEFLSTHVKEYGARICQDLLAGLNIAPEFAYFPWEELEIPAEPFTTMSSNDKGSKSKGKFKKQQSKRIIVKDDSSDNVGTTRRMTLRGSTTIPGSNLSNKKQMKKNMTIEMTHENGKSGEVGDEFHVTGPGATKKIYQPIVLSASQKATNLTLNFLNEICLADDRITARQILKNNRFFVFLQMQRVIIDAGQAQFNLYENMQMGLQRLLNVFEVSNTPLERYLINFEKISRFIQQELVPTISSTDDSHLKFFFFATMSKKGSALVKQTVNKVENYLGLAELDDSDKLSFSTAQTNIKRELDHNLRAFKEFIDLEDNKKVALRQQSMIKHQELRLMQEVASLMLLVHTYYLKQNVFTRVPNKLENRGEQQF